MRKLIVKVAIAYTVFYLILCSVVNADNPKEIKIIAEQENIKVGEPLIIKVTYKFEQPQFSNRAENFFTSIGPHATVQIKKDDEEILTQGHHLGPGDLYLKDTEGLKYSGDFMFFYDFFNNKLIFDTPGVYTITVRRTRTTISNTLNITVEPATDVNKRALSLLSDPNDYFLLEFGETQDQNARREGLLHLKKVFEQSKDALLSKWAAARLGIEEIKELEAKYPSAEKFAVQYRQKKIDEPLVSEAHSHLTKALSLPDVFPSREEVLYRLISAEIMRGDYQKALSYTTEMGEKYPKGEYGQRASKIHAEISEFQSRDLEQSQNSPLGQSQHRIALPVVVAAVAVGIVLIVLFFIFKKKNASRSMRV